MPILADLLAGWAPLPVAAQRAIAMSGPEGHRLLLLGVPCDPTLAGELLGKPQVSPIAADLIERHVDGAGLTQFLRKPERRIGVLRAVLEHFVLTPQQQCRLARSGAAPLELKVTLLRSGWADLSVTRDLLPGLPLFEQLGYVGSVNCHPGLTDDDIWQAITTGADSLRVPRPLVRGTQTLEDVLKRADTESGPLVPPLVRLLFLRPGLRERAFELASEGSWVAMAALAYLHLTAEQFVRLADLIVAQWPETMNLYSGCIKAVSALAVNQRLPAQVLITMAAHVAAHKDDLVSCPRARTGFTSRIRGSDPTFVLRMPQLTSHIVGFDALRVLERASEHVRAGKRTPAWAKLARAAVKLLVSSARSDGYLIPDELVGFVGYDWWMSLTGSQQEALEERSTFAREELRRSLGTSAATVALAGEAARRPRELKFNYRAHEGIVRPDAHETLTWTLAEASSKLTASPYSWRECARFTTLWFGEQFGDDRARWECALTLAETFTGTLEELVVTVNLLQAP